MLPENLTILTFSFALVVSQVGRTDIHTVLKL